MLQPHVLLAHLEGRAVDDDQKVRPALLQPLGDILDPHVLADHGPEAHGTTARKVEAHRPRDGSRGEHPLLVEDPVIGQLVLGPPALDDAIGEEADAVVGPCFALDPGGTHQDRRPAAGGIGGELLEQCRRALQECRLQDQVLERVAGECQLRKDHEIGAGLCRLPMQVADQGEIAVEIADGRVALGKGDGEGSGQGRASSTVQIC
jgi:hypothetical protein